MPKASKKKGPKSSVRKKLTRRKHDSKKKSRTSQPVQTKSLAECSASAAEASQEINEARPPTLQHSDEAGPSTSKDYNDAGPDDSVQTKSLAECSASAAEASQEINEARPPTPQHSDEAGPSTSKDYNDAGPDEFPKTFQTEDEGTSQPPSSPKHADIFIAAPAPGLGILPIIEGDTTESYTHVVVIEGYRNVSTMDTSTESLENMDFELSSCSPARLDSDPADTFQAGGAGPSRISHEVETIVHSPENVDIYSPELVDLATENKENSDDNSELPFPKHSTDDGSFDSDSDIECKSTEVNDLKEQENPPLPPASPINSQLLECVKTRISLLLPENWIPYATDNGFRIGFVPRGEHFIVQRSLFFGGDGRISAWVHCKQLSANHGFWENVRRVELTQETVTEFSNNVVKVVAHLRTFEVCTGVTEFESVWKRSPTSEIDLNRFKERRYQKSCRSAECLLLVNVKAHRCNSCTKLWKFFSRNHKKDESIKTPDRRTTFKQMNTPQKKKAFKRLQKKTHKLDMSNRRLKQKIEELVRDDGVGVDDVLSKSFAELLSSEGVKEKLTPMQAIFIQEQLKAAEAKSPSAMRWHPAIIRLALTIQMTSPKAYEELRGLLRFPSQRQLLDYSHIFEAKEGLQDAIIRELGEELEKLNPEPHQTFFVVTFDGMKIRKNLVYSKKTGEMTGYVHLDKVHEELAELDRLLSDEVLGEKTPTEIKLPVADEIMCYMAIGIENDLKGVVAIYPSSHLTSEQEYEWTWDVIGDLELNNLRVLALVADGAAINVGCYQMHTPLENTTSGVVFVTRNLYAPDRPLYLLNDPPHLLKTLRNCLHRSGKKGKKGVPVRLMKKNGQEIVWKTVLNLYERRKKDTLRKLFKLNQEDVFLTSYSVMRVACAARVLSRSVEMMIHQLGWTDCEEFAKYCRVCNDFFDMMNGAHDYHGVRTRNDLFHPYISVEDERFDRLKGILNYFNEWRQEIDALKITQAEKARRFISIQSFRNLERTILGFIGAVQYLIVQGKESTKPPKVKAGRFSQDKLENYNSKQRSKLGANTHPDLAQALQNNVNIFMQSKLSLRGKKTSNTGGDKRTLTEEDISKPLPKRQSQKSLFVASTSRNC